MKLIYGTGDVLEVRELGPVIFLLTARDVPIKVNGYHVLEDDAARAELRALLDTGLYDGGKVNAV